MTFGQKPTWRSRLSRYSLVGWLRYLRLRLLGRQVRVEGHCRMCGRCCQRISLEAGGRWLRSKKEFGRLLAANPEYSRFEVVDYDQQGFLLFTCSWFDSQKGICRDHQDRLPVCSNYPETELYFTGGELHAGCGYRFSLVKSFATVLAREMSPKNDKHQKTPDC